MYSSRTYKKQKKKTEKKIYKKKRLQLNFKVCNGNPNGVIKSNDYDG